MVYLSRRALERSRVMTRPLLGACAIRIVQNVTLNVAASRTADVRLAVALRHFGKGESHRLLQPMWILILLQVYDSFDELSLWLASRRQEACLGFELALRFLEGLGTLDVFFGWNET